MSVNVCEEYGGQISNIKKLELQVDVGFWMWCCELNSVLLRSNKHLRALYQSLLTAKYYSKSKTSCLMIHNFILAVRGNIQFSLSLALVTKNKSIMLGSKKVYSDVSIFRIISEGLLKI